MAGRRTHRAAPGGFTLLEVIITIAVVGLIMASAVRGFRSMAKTDLRAAANHLSGAMRYMFDRASATGKVHRLVIDVANNRYSAEISDDRFYIPREKESDDSRLKDLETQRQEAELMRKKAELAAQSPAAYYAAEMEPQDFRPKRPAFAAFHDSTLKQVTIKRAKIVDVYTPRLLEAQTAGRAYVYFFPLGQAEPAIVHISDVDGKTFYSLVVHPLTGRVRVIEGYVDIPRAERFDDEGNRLEL